MHGGREWLVTPEGVSSRGEGGEPVALHRTRGEPTSMRLYLALWGRWLLEAVVAEQVPLAILLQVLATENGACRVDENRVHVIPWRKEPGYVSDEATTHRISIGPSHILISSARAAMADPSIDRAWLLDTRNNIRACARFIRNQRQATGYDPVLVAAAYNAGGLYNALPGTKWGNRWHLRTYGSHLDRALSWYGDAVAALYEIRELWALDLAGLGRVVTERAA